jgi:ubiquitin C-terminal hydrolase
MWMSPLLSLLAASTQLATASPTEYRPQSKTEEAVKVCRRGSLSGSHIVQTVCRTGKEWAAIDATFLRVPLQGAPAVYP